MGAPERPGAAGAGGSGADDGWIRLFLADDAPFLLGAPPEVELSDLARAVEEALADGSALFFRQVYD
ncbi:MAG TPA: hypothetical protein PKC22_08660, partial [Rhodocyclaceae bacterium]|nr:hypothetical protein [Rhodocyclaceae bacterium]